VTDADAIQYAHQLTSTAPAAATTLYDRIDGINSDWPGLRWFPRFDQQNFATFCAVDSRIIAFRVDESTDATYCQ